MPLWHRPARHKLFLRDKWKYGNLGHRNLGLGRLNYPIVSPCVLATRTENILTNIVALIRFLTDQGDHLIAMAFKATGNVEFEQYHLNLRSGEIGLAQQFVNTDGCRGQA